MSAETTPSPTMPPSLRSYFPDTVFPLPDFEMQQNDAVEKIHELLKELESKIAEKTATEQEHMTAQALKLRLNELAPDALPPFVSEYKIATILFKHQQADIHTRETHGSEPAKLWLQRALNHAITFSAMSISKDQVSLSGETLLSLLGEYSYALRKLLEYCPAHSFPKELLEQANLEARNRVSTVFSRNISNYSDREPMVVINSFLEQVLLQILLSNTPQYAHNAIRNLFAEQYYHIIKARFRISQAKIYVQRESGFSINPFKHCDEIIQSVQLYLQQQEEHFPHRAILDYNLLYGPDNLRAAYLAGLKGGYNLSRGDGRGMETYYTGVTIGRGIGRKANKRTDNRGQQGKGYKRNYGGLNI